ncbi:LysR family transcriptional regulator [Alteromonas alvinellae]
MVCCMDWSRHLKLKHISLLIHLNESKSLSKTANAFYTTQPALSRWLKELEQDVGGVLFERKARGLQVTLLGELLLEHAIRIQAEIERAQENISAAKNGSGRTIAIGTSPASAPSFVPTAIAKFLKLHPQASVRVQESTMNILLSQLARGDLDVVVGRLDNYQPSSKFHNEHLYSENICIVSRPGHPLTQKKTLYWDDLLMFDWIVWPDGSPIRRKFDASLTLAGQKPPMYRVESSSQVANLWLLQHSNMLSVASEEVANHFKRRGFMEPLNIDVAGDDGSVGMCWRDEVVDDKAVEALLECFREASCMLNED